jgi:cobalt-zinc-cadmium efflux system outer membrane protein
MSLTIVFFSLALAAEPAAAAPVWTEADALEAFERGSPALAEARAAEASARGDVTQAGLLPNPQLSVSASNFPIVPNTTPGGDGPGVAHNLVTSVALEQPVELGGKRGKRLAASRGALAEATLASADALRGARFDLLRAFWQAVKAKNRRELAEKVGLRFSETVRITRARYANQDISRVDLDKVELEALRNQNDLADARAEERTAVADLLGQVGPAAPAWVQVSGDLASRPLPLELEPLLARAGEARPDLREAERRVETARANLALAEAQRVPDVSVGLAYTHSRAIPAGDNPDSFAVTLGLPLPIFNRNQGEIAKARIAIDRAERARDALFAKVGTEVAAAHARYVAATDKVVRYDTDALRLADRALEVAERSWRAGDISLLAFLEAERTYIALRGDYLDTLFELRQAALELERATGVPKLGEDT